MLIFGKAVSDWKEKAAYAQEKGLNDCAKLHEVRCEGIEGVQEAFAAMAAFAADGKCKKFLYHATINLDTSERLTREQWRHAIDTLEQNLKLTDHYRVVFEHIKKDRQHYHIVWSRIPPEGGAAVNMGNDFYVHQNTAKALEREFAIKQAPRRDQEKPSHKKREINDRNSRIRVRPDIATKDATKAYHDSGTSKEFIRNLAKAGYVLCHGKNKSLVLVDKKGGYHGLLRRIDGVKLGDVKKKFPALEGMALPKLNAVLKMRRQSVSLGSFKSIARMLAAASRRGHAPYLASGYRPIFYKPAGISIEALLLRLRRRYPEENETKYYPLPLMRKRRIKKDENKPSRPSINLNDIANAELLAWAWENGRFDILRDFGIILPPDYFEP